MEGFGEHYGVSSLHPLGLLAVVVLGVAAILLPRRYAVAPMLIMACFIAPAQRLVIMGADFDLLRILVLFAWIRLFLRGEFEGFVWNRLDSLFTGWMVSGALIYTLAYGSTSALINRCGWMFDGLGMYFFFRCVLRDWRDFEFLVRVIIVISFPVAVAFLIERATGRNMFAIFGGVREITWVREGRLRCQGAYAHAILAGCFWVGLMPWMVVTGFMRRQWLAWAGVGSAMVVIITCSSSTPLMALIFMLLGLSLYAARSYIQLIRWGFFLLLFLLHFLMEKPIWHLIARVNVVGGSTGWHRFKIMDATIENFSKWWLFGEPNPMSWGVWEMRDITNQYILEALRGGLLTLICFVGMIVVAFRMVGRALASCGDKTPEHVFVWSIGTALFVHVSIFFSVSYFGQIIMLWYLTLAMIGSLPGITGSQPQPVAVASSAPVAPPTPLFRGARGGR